SDLIVDEYIAKAVVDRGPDRLADPEAFCAEIALTRQRGYSIDDEEDAPGVRCLGVAVRGAAGTPLFAISLTGPSARFTMERVIAAAPRVVEIARQLSLSLGWEPESTAVPKYGQAGSSRRQAGPALDRTAAGTNGIDRV
ncbi:MAG: IclR family transcriptional regulator domain-containing protein, partial [Thermomicrobiales bacterium]